MERAMKWMAFRLELLFAVVFNIPAMIVGFVLCFVVPFFRNLEGVDLDEYLEEIWDRAMVEYERCAYNGYERIAGVSFGYLMVAEQIKDIRYC